ncbi:hypothetical protein HMPREF1552_00809 [Leptotrichia sp. oral taxon 879 str. F0557]|nr:hypothetical protein HMPREF1552_00809 [Leptotrichia sp. oral taxon 879 str. F0557]
MLKHTKNVFKKQNKGKSVILHFLYKLRKNREKAYELYFSRKRIDSMEKVIGMEYLLDIVNKISKKHKHSIFKMTRMSNEESSEGNITKQNNLKKQLKKDYCILL